MIQIYHFHFKDKVLSSNLWSNKNAFTKKIRCHNWMSYITSDSMGSEMLGFHSRNVLLKYSSKIYLSRAQEKRDKTICPRQLVAHHFPTPAIMDAGRSSTHHHCFEGVMLKPIIRCCVSRRVSLRFSYIAAVILLKNQDHISQQNPFVKLILGLTIDFPKAHSPTRFDNWSGCFRRTRLCVSWV